MPFYLPSQTSNQVKCRGMKNNVNTAQNLVENNPKLK